MCRVLWWRGKGVREAGEVSIEIEQCEAVSWRNGSVGGEVGQLRESPLEPQDLHYCLDLGQT